MVLDLEHGNVEADLNGDGTIGTLTISTLSGTAYLLDSSIKSIIVKDKDNNLIEGLTFSIDPVTGYLTGSLTAEIPDQILIFLQ